MTEELEWTECDTATYAADQTVINGHTVVVCIDDEGPLSPAYYWNIDDHRGYDSATGEWMAGWASSICNARIDAVAQARRLPPKGER